MAKSQVGVPFQGLFSVSASPSIVSVLSVNGAASSPLVRSAVVNGVGPFVYLWTITGDKITIKNKDSSGTSFSSGGFNSFYEEVATLTITDSGNLDEVTSVSVNVSFKFKNEGIEDV